MSSFSIKTTHTRRQAEELRSEYLSLRAYTAELNNVIGRLREMSEFQNDILWLRRIERRATEQYDTLREMSSALYEVTDKYQDCERRNLDSLEGGSEWSSGIRIAINVLRMDEGLNSASWLIERFAIHKRKMLPRNVTVMISLLFQTMRK